MCWISIALNTQISFFKKIPGSKVLGEAADNITCFTYLIVLSPLSDLLWSFSRFCYL